MFPKVLRNQIIEGLHGRPILLDLYWVPDNQPKPVVIFTHGFKGFKDWGHFNLLGKRMAEAGFVFIKYNGSYNGTTPENPEEFTDLEAFGHNNFSIELDDLGQVINWIMEEQDQVDPHEIDTTGIGLIGHSRGGGIVILKAKEDPRVKRIVTWASVSEFGRYWSPDIMRQWKEAGVHYVVNSRTGQRMPLYYQLYEDYFAHLDRLHIPSAEKNLTIPHLIIHGTADEGVPFTSAEELKSWNPKSTFLRIEGAGHTFGVKHPWESGTLPEQAEQVVQATMDFLQFSR